MTKENTKAIGLMSGTSMDGVDVALISTDGETIGDFGPVGFRPYSEAERDLLRQALATATGLMDREDRPGVLGEAERMVTAAHAEAVEQFLTDNGLANDEIGVVGFHGQTVLHRPVDGLTVQIGDGKELARRLGLTVVSDFRAADVADGGQGAPFVPVYHKALVEKARLAKPVAVVNIGGVANITYISDDGLIACDTGPGNALLDDFMLRRAGAPCDTDGVLAARGRVDEIWVDNVMMHPFFALSPPKSLDRNDFAVIRQMDWSVEDGAATLTALTAAAIGSIVALLPDTPKRWIIGGGGAHNPTLLRMLEDELNTPVVTADSLDWAGDAIEAQAFAYLAVRSLRGLPLSFAGTTGVSRPMPGGVVTKP